MINLKGRTALVTGGSRRIGKAILVELAQAGADTWAVIKPMLKAKYGRIINIGSIVGTTENPGQVNYSSAKAG